MALQLRLTRDQIAKAFRDDPEAIKQFEKMVAAVDRMIQAGGFLASSTFAIAADAASRGLASVGARTTITDSTLTAAGNFGAVVAGGGANAVPAWFDGTDWRIG